jgi:capsular exopolysaccharide synthesis family protein
MSVPAETIGSATLIPNATESVVVALTAPESPAAEQFRVFNQRLERLGATRPLRVVAISSSARREGRTTVAVNLALTAAQAGRRVVLVECDLRKPSVSALLDLTPRAGLAEVLTGSAELGQALCRVGNLAVLCAGSAHDPAGALRSPRLPELFADLRAAYDLVLLDAPPALAFADADRLSAAADGVLLVVRAHSTPREVARLAAATLGAKLVGVVLNAVDTAGSLHARYLYADPTAA